MNSDITSFFCFFFQKKKKKEFIAGNVSDGIRNENIIRSNKYEPQQNDAQSSTIEVTQFSRLKSFRKAVHGRMRFFTG